MRRRRVFFIEAESGVGERLEKRVQMTGLMREMRAGDLVICDKLDRWSRDTEHTLRSIREIREAGAAFYAVHERYDSTSTDGDLMLTIRAALAKEEHARIKARMVGTRRLVRDRGYYSEGLPPLGYRRAHPKGHKGIEKNVLVSVPDEAELVRRIFKMYVGGLSMTKIAGKFGPKLDRVQDALHRRVYTGEMQNARVSGSRASTRRLSRRIRSSALRRSSRNARSAGRGRVRRVPKRLIGFCGTSRGARCAARRWARPTKARRTRGATTTTGARRSARASSCGSSRWKSHDAARALARLGELREQIAAGEETKEPKAPAEDFEARRAKVQRRRERFLEAFADELMTRDELSSRLAKLDAERLQIDGEELAGKAPAPLADAGVRRAALRQAQTW